MDDYDPEDEDGCDNEKHARSEVILRKALYRMLRWCYENQITIQLGSALGSFANIVQTQASPFTGFQNVSDKIGIDPLINTIAHEMEIHIKPNQPEIKSMPLSMAPPHIQQAAEHAMQQMNQAKKPKPAPPPPQSDSDFVLPPDFPPFDPYKDHLS